MNVVRAISNEGVGRTNYYREIRGRLDTDPELQHFLSGASIKVPQFYQDKLRRSLGPLHEYLPEGSAYHDQNAYLKSSTTLHQLTTRES